MTARSKSMVEIEHLYKNFGAEVAVRDVNLAVAPGEFVTLLGPSGCGKTTTLRCIAGLEKPDGGEIRIDGTVVASAERSLYLNPEDRNIGMVFQSYAVWPHMNVRENIAFPLREGVRKLPAAEVRARTDEVLDLLALSDMADRPVTTLSGGQQQRVALARALALRPKVLLMDEPLSNLDFVLQVRLRGQLKELMPAIIVGQAGGYALLDTPSGRPRRGVHRQPGRRGVSSAILIREAD